VVDDPLKCYLHSPLGGGTAHLPVHAEVGGLMQTNQRWPRAVEDGLIPTDNAMGVMTEEPSPAGEAFIALAARAGRPLLEVGAAYGNATLPALRAGGTVIANDLSASELGVLASAASGEDRKRLVLMPARFPDEVHLGDESLSGVLAAEVLHSSMDRRSSVPSAASCAGSSPAARCTCP